MLQLRARPFTSLSICSEAVASISRKIFLLFLISECCAALAVIVALAFVPSGQRWSMVAWMISLALVGVIVLLPLVRFIAYRQYVPYDPRRDVAYDFSLTAGKSIAVSLDENGFDWPVGIDGDFDTALLAFLPRATPLGKWLNPQLEIRSGDAIWRQWLERGVDGRRHLDLSACLQPSLSGNRRIGLVGRHVRWDRTGTLLLFRNEIRPETRILVVAPHPDDAELAAFGLYSRCNSSIITICAGDAGSYQYSGAADTGHTAAQWRADIRVRESITVPYLGGVPPSRCANLCCRDNSLAGMYAARAGAQSSHSQALRNAKQLRELNLATNWIDTAQRRYVEQFGRRFMPGYHGRESGSRCVAAPAAR